MEIHPGAPGPSAQVARKIRLGNTSEIQVVFKNPTSKLKTRDADLMFLPLDDEGQSIGLPLSYRLIKDMGGLLSYEEEVDKIVFTLSLPKFDLEAAHDTENA